MSAIFVANISAQEMKAEKAELKKDKKECKFSREERIEMEIKMLSDELYLSEDQEAKFAEMYREYMDEKAKLKEKFKERFGEVLNKRQVERVLHPKGPRHGGPRPEGPMPGFGNPGFEKPGFDKKCDKKCPQHGGPRPEKAE